MKTVSRRWGEEEHGGVIENPTSGFPRCRSALIARNCVRASWNFLSLSLSLFLLLWKKKEVTPVQTIGTMADFLLVTMIDSFRGYRSRFF